MARVAGESAARGVKLLRGDHDRDDDRLGHLLCRAGYVENAVLSGGVQQGPGAPPLILLIVLRTSDPKVVGPASTPDCRERAAG